MLLSKTKNSKRPQESSDDTSLCWGGLFYRAQMVTHLVQQIDYATHEIDRVLGY